MEVAAAIWLMVAIVFTVELVVKFYNAIMHTKNTAEKEPPYSFNWRLFTTFMVAISWGLFYLFNKL